MTEPSQIIRTIEIFFNNKNQNKKFKAIVTAGPTQEFLDPVRFITNKSSGKQGFAIAESLRDNGFDTTLITGPTNLKDIPDIKIIKINKVEELKLDGLFIAIGHDPATQLFKDQLNMDKEGYLITKPDSTETNIPGVYAAGDVKDKTFRQAVTAAGMGWMAALEAEKFLSH